MMSAPSSQPRRLILLVVGLLLEPVAARRGGPRGGIYGFGIIGGPPALTATFFVAIAILVLGVVFGAYACYRYQQRKNWNQRVDQAEEAVWQNAMQNNKKPTEATVVFRTCTFTTSYKERNGDDCTSKGTLEFTATQEKLLTTSKEGHSSCVATPCLAITGHGTNQNGTFVVKGGKLSPATGLCYWLEEATEKKACLKESKQILITGRFSLSKAANIDEFVEGRWASYHDWGWVTDGKMDQFDLLSKAGSVVSKK